MCGSRDTFASKGPQIVKWFAGGAPVRPNDVKWISGAEFKRAFPSEARAFSYDFMKLIPVVDNRDYAVGAIGSSVRPITRRVIFVDTDKPTKCGAMCRNAKGPMCDCSCKGENHGASVAMSRARFAELDLKPTAEMAANAARGLELREKHGKGGTAVGVARARDIKNQANLSPSTVKRMHSFFSRHEGNQKGGEDDAGYIAWLLWGGDAGKAWAARKSAQIDKSESARFSTGFNGFVDPWSAMNAEDRREAGRLSIAALKAMPSSPRQREIRAKLNAILARYGLDKPPEQRMARSRFSHDIRLPKGKRRLNIDEAHAALAQMGYKLGTVRYDPAAGGSVYKVTQPNGSVIDMPAAKLTDFIYEKAKHMKSGTKAAFAANKEQIVHSFGDGWQVVQRHDGYSGHNVLVLQRIPAQGHQSVRVSSVAEAKVKHDAITNWVFRATVVERKPNEWVIQATPADGGYGLGGRGGKPFPSAQKAKEELSKMQDKYRQKAGMSRAGAKAAFASAGEVADFFKTLADVERAEMRGDTAKMRSLLQSVAAMVQRDRSKLPSDALAYYDGLRKKAGMSRAGAKAAFSIDAVKTAAEQVAKAYGAGADSAAVRTRLDKIVRLLASGSAGGQREALGIHAQIGGIAEAAHGRDFMWSQPMQNLEKAIRSAGQFSRVRFANWEITPTKKHGQPIEEHTAKIGGKYFKIDTMPHLGADFGSLYVWDDLRGLKPIASGRIAALKRQAEALATNDALSRIILGEFSRAGAKAKFGLERSINIMLSDARIPDSAFDWVNGVLVVDPSHYDRIVEVLNGYIPWELNRLPRIQKQKMSRAGAKAAFAHPSWSAGLLGKETAPQLAAYSWIDAHLGINGHRTQMLLADIAAEVHARNPALSIQQAVIKAAQEMVQKGVATYDIRALVEDKGWMSRAGAKSDGLTLAQRIAVEHDAKRMANR